ncbi:hypothetical protein RF11_09591 [Thelohanellus kitauei]|uniref:Uncharacterized protein n=1 Tax=Thelohanellus kitauei TaxID=669202 RepID=A0A0C2IAC8_THEKT|nr:hypothetical protein RF11_09591 [Thelohanellus kitauei]
MIHRVGLMGVVEFNMSLFYDVTTSIFYDQIEEGKDLKLVSLVSKTWSSILNQSKNGIYIDKKSKLIHLAGIFAIDLVRKLKKIYQKSGRLVFTENKKQRIYIIYFTLIAFPFANQESTPWLVEVLNELHSCVHIYIDKHSLDDLSFENKFLIQLYYIKSHVTLKLENSKVYQEMKACILGNLETTQAFKLHYSYLYCHTIIYLYQCCHRNAPCFNNDFIPIRNLVNQLVRALWKNTYINQIQNEEQKYMYQNLNNKYLSIIDKNLIRSVLSECEFRLWVKIDYDDPEILGDDSNVSRKIMALTVDSFKNKNYLDSKTARCCMRLLNENSNISLLTKCNDMYSGIGNDSIHDQNMLLKSNDFSRLSIKELLKWFCHIYESKFIFGEIN